MNIIKNYLGRGSSSEPKLIDDDLEILYDRIKNSVNLKDRREAISILLATAIEDRKVLFPRKKIFLKYLRRDSLTSKLLVAKKKKGNHNRLFRWPLTSNKE